MYLWRWIKFFWLHVITPNLLDMKFNGVHSIRAREREGKRERAKEFTMITARSPSTERIHSKLIYTYTIEVVKCLSENKNKTKTVTMTAEETSRNQRKVSSEIKEETKQQQHQDKSYWDFCPCTKKRRNHSSASQSVDSYQCLWQHLQFLVYWIQNEIISIARNHHGHKCHYHYFENSTPQINLNAARFFLVTCFSLSLHVQSPQLFLKRII